MERKKESNHLFLCIDFDQYLLNECRRYDKWHTIYTGTLFLNACELQFFAASAFSKATGFYVKQMKISHLKQMRNVVRFNTCTNRVFVFDTKGSFHYRSVMTHSSLAQQCLFINICTIARVANNICAM